MDAERLDGLATRVAQLLTRRRVGVIGAGAIAGALAAEGTTAKRRKKRPCPPCVGRKKGKCRKPLADGTPCAMGVCRGGQCACVPATCASLGKTCGIAPDGCGGTLGCGRCSLGPTPSCNNGTCAVCSAVCPGTCNACFGLPDGSTVCGDGGSPNCAAGCSSNADCPSNRPVCITSATDRATGETVNYPALCGVGTPGICYTITPC
ncbi:MAG: hypothetical protein QM692_08250 [Thermomicrobiales bacterium]